ncbi:MAG: N-acetylmuramoyl-L-alanine amidase [candidate division WOR-3 bacterium]|nr:N-acetylmuramoyl-L-alanine amidase [candidate division WOR-3 bacterium]
MTLLLLSLLCFVPNKYRLTYEETSIVLEPERFELHDYVSLKSVAELLGLGYIMDNTTQQLHLTQGGRRFLLIPDIRTIEYGNHYYHLPFAPVYRNGEVYFPVQLITTTLGSAFEKLIFIKSVTEIPIINKISLLSRADSTVVKFTWTGYIDFDVRFSTRLAIIEIDGIYKEKPTLKPKGAVTDAKLTPHNTYTSIEMALEGVNSVIERDDEVVFFNKVSKKVALIVLDAGHGGIDPGAVGKKGLYEKDVNLAICKMLRDVVEDSLKIRVILSRDRDVYLSLKERTNIANRNAADIFVSIHCNAHLKGAPRSGFETYFLSDAKTSEERAVAALENASLKFDNLVMPNGDLSFILYDLAQSAFLDESNHLAENIQISAEKHLKIPSRGVKQAGFYVLNGAFMPAVLVECAFISNPAEEKMLRQKNFQKELAFCIYRGIKSYIEDYERRLNN